jgi:hypothetical protein
MHHIRAAHEIRTLGVSKSLIATLAGLHRPDFIAWTNGKAKLSPAKIERISAVLADLKEIVQASEQLGISFNLTNAQNVKNIIEAATKAKAQAELQNAEADLQRVLGEAASVFNLTLT